jgi:hypothetical protein
MLSEEQIEAARIAVFKEHGSDLIPAVATSMARAIEAEVRKQDEELIRQLLNALRIDRIDTEDWPADSRIALDALRARLEGKP